MPTKKTTEKKGSPKKPAKDQIVNNPAPAPASPARDQNPAQNNDKIVTDQEQNNDKIVTDPGQVQGANTTKKEPAAGSMTPAGDSPDPPPGEYEKTVIKANDQFEKDIQEAMDIRSEAIAEMEKIYKDTSARIQADYEEAYKIAWGKFRKATGEPA